MYVVVCLQRLCRFAPLLLLLAVVVMSSSFACADDGTDFGSGDNCRLIKG